MPQVTDFAVQNWLITPEALALNEAKPSNISQQRFLLVLSGVCVIDLQGNNPDDWRRETFTILPDFLTPLNFAITKYGIPRPIQANTVAAMELEQWVLYSAVGSVFERQSGGVDAGFAVDSWRVTPFVPTSGSGGQTLNQVFTGMDVDVAVRNNNATLHRISFQINLLGRIVFVPKQIVVEPNKPVTKK